MYFALLILVIGFDEIYSKEGNSDPSSHPNWRYLQHSTCGHSTAFRIIGGKNASLGAYPWIARIGYSYGRNETPEFRCGGVIINERTVLTAAHCVFNLPPEYKVSVVRLGEHYTLTDPDCEDEVCAEPVQDLVPSEIITHSKYDKPPYKNDIAIIRLQKNISFNSYVSPICLLNGTSLTKNYTSSICEVAGWGIYNIDNPKPSEILLTLNIAIVDNNECANAFRRYANIDETQLCVGGNVGEDSCGGDSGGPLMKVEDAAPPRYFLLGLVSFGARRCGSNKTPGVYTKVSEFMPWILDNLVKSTSSFKVVQPRII